MSCRWCESKRLRTSSIAIPVFEATAEWSMTCVHLRGITQGRAPSCHLHLSTDFHAISGVLIILALIAPENAMLGRRSFDPFWSSLVGRCKLLISGSVDVAHIVYILCRFLWPITCHLSSFSYPPPAATQTKAPKEQLVAFSKNGILFEQNSEIRRCFGWRPCNNLFRFPPWKTHRGRIFVGSTSRKKGLRGFHQVWKNHGLGQPTRP